jgi:LysR family transcriptional regulator, benzoate and cis,cis-muconate-responsive activator of ben and cat genes
MQLFVLLIKQASDAVATGMVPRTALNLNHLRAFVAVADCLSFSRAAQRLHISQPALSNQIRLLEEDFDAKLFVRNQRSVALTSVGKDILDDVQRLLSGADEIKQRVRRALKGTLGVLRIGFVASATADIVPRLAVTFRKSFPEVSLELKNMPTMLQVDALRQRILDVGIVRLPLGEPDIEVLPLFSEPFAIVVSKQHPFISRDRISVRDLEREPFVSYSERLAPAFFQHWTGLCRKAGFTPRILQEVAEMETALALVSAGVGVAILPEGVARRHRRAIKVVGLKEERIRSEIGLAFLKLNPPPLARRLVTSATSAGLLERRLKSS